MTEETPMSVIESALSEVFDERLEQELRWGRQDHPIVFSENERRAFNRHEERWKAINAARAAGGSLAFDGILLEEVFEALSARTRKQQRAELVQVAAVAVAAVEAIDRDLLADPPESVVVLPTKVVVTEEGEAA